MEGEGKGSHAWRPMECSKLGGQWKEKEKVPMFGGQWNVPSCLSFGLTFESFKELGVRQVVPSAEDGGVIFVLEKASLEAAKVGKVKKTKEIPSPFLSREEGGEFFF
jgi:hypothetical protein